jgi:hypothetical protein
MCARTIQRESRCGNVKRACQLLKVSRFAYYADAAVQAAGGSARAQADAYRRRRGDDGGMSTIVFVSFRVLDRYRGL